ANLGNRLGTFAFIFLQLVLAAVWLAVNGVPALHHWDPYPFPLLTLVLVSETLFAGILLLMALHRSHLRERLRAQMQFETDVKLEEEMRSVMTHLEAQDDMLLQVLQRLDRVERELRRVQREASGSQD